MKKTVIGISILMVGAYVLINSITNTLAFSESINQWRGNKFIYIAFHSGDMSTNYISLGIPLIIGVLMFLTGLSLLLVEYFEE